MTDIPKIEIPALRADGTTQRIVAPAGERVGVLIVDDTPAKLVALAAIVSGMALEIVTATSGEQALCQLLKRDFALILLDVKMPTMDGLETAQLIRSRPRSEHTPIIFVTAEAYYSDAERISGYTLGAVDFIYSPIIPEILRAKVQVFVNLFYLQRQVLLHNEHLESLVFVVEQRTVALTEEIVERKRAEEKVKRLNRIYAVLSGINATIVRVRVRDRQELFAEACRIAVEHGQFRMAWIGLLDPNGVDITPVAKAGFDDGYLDQIRLTARDDVPDSCLLEARALRGHVPIICNDIGADPRMARWREGALQRGYRSLIVFPLVVEDKAVGLLALYASEKDFFDTEEMRLLADITGDISFALDYIEREERLNYLAHYDALTALPNRILLSDRLNQAMIRSRRDGLSVAVAFLDLDDFKQVNDQHGHAMGDTLLITLATRMKAELREGDTLARIGGDEFVAVLVGQIDANVYVPILDRLLKATSTPVTVDGQVLQVSASIGVTLYPHDGGDADMLLRHADQAMYLAKQVGKNRCHLFDVVQDTAAFAAGMPDAAAKATVNATVLKLE